MNIVQLLKNSMVKRRGVCDERKTIGLIINKFLEVRGYVLFVDFFLGRCRFRGGNLNKNTFRGIRPQLHYAITELWDNYHTLTPMCISIC